MAVLFCLVGSKIGLVDKFTSHVCHAHAASLDVRGPKWRQRGPEVRQSTVPTAQQNFHGLKGASLDLKPFSLSIHLNLAGAV